jgi:small subunit ribosomal protein S14
MAKVSSVQKNNRRRKMSIDTRATRDRLKAIVMNKATTIEDRINASIKLAEMPRNSSPTRVRNRCEVSGRPRGYHRKFGMSRIALRELGSAGCIPGLTKSSW